MNKEKENILNMLTQSIINYKSEYTKYSDEELIEITKRNWNYFFKALIQSHQPMDFIVGINKNYSNLITTESKVMIISRPLDFFRHSDELFKEGYNKVYINFIINKGQLTLEAKNDCIFDIGFDI